MPMRVLFVVALVLGILGSWAINKLRRNRLEEMLFAVVLLLTGGFLLNMRSNLPFRTWEIAIELILVGFILGVAGFFKSK